MLVLSIIICMLCPMSKLVPNITDTARVFREKPLVGKFEKGHTTICLVTPFMGFELCKREPKGRFFADRKMIAHSGGPWFLRNFKPALEAKLSQLAVLHLSVTIGDVEAKDLFSYQTCMIHLHTDTSMRSTPIALELVQKAMLFAIADEVLERQIAVIA